MKRKMIIAAVITFTCITGHAQPPAKVKLDQYFDRLAEKNKAMGGLIIVNKGNVLYSRAFGQSHNKPLTMETKYRIGSVTKTFTASMVFQLIEEGKLKPEQTIDKYLPTVPNAKKITVFHLLSHHSGIPDATEDPEFRALRYTGTSKEQMIASIAKGKPHFEPGEKFAYSNSGYFLLANIIEKVTGETYEEALKKRILSKAGLKDTYNGTGRIDAGKNESFSYKYVTDWVQQPETHITLAFGGGSMISTAPDLAKFIQALFDGKLVSPKSLDQMIKNECGLDDYTYNGKTFYGFEGGIDGFGSWLVYQPEEKLALCYVTNGKVYPVKNLIDDIFEMYYNKPFTIPTFESMKVSNEILDKYVGVYVPEGAQVKFYIRREGETLIMQMNQQNPIALEPISENKFKVGYSNMEIEFDVPKNQVIMRQGGGDGPGRVLRKETNAPVAATEDKNTAIDKIFSWTKPTAPGCVCAVSQNGKLVVNRAYGSADLERDVPININTIFDAGSVSKQFVAAAALLLADDGKIALDDDIHKYIPELPGYGEKITIEQLMTHTSGIREWTGMLQFAGDKPHVFPLILRQRKLNFKPGESWSYSTSGFELLKEVVARVSKMSFAAFVQKRIFDTLGMKSSSYRDNTRDIIRNRALAYERDGSGRWKMAILFDNDRGGGGVHTTASDMLIWNEAITNNRLGKFMSEKLQEPATLNNGRKLTYGHGLFLESYRGAKEIWHSGSAAGYKTWLGRYPEHGLSIAIMCNSGDGTDRIDFAHKIFELYLPEITTPDFDPAPAPVKDIDPNKLAGLFFNETTGEALRIAVQNGRLRVAEGPGLDQITNDRFKRRGSNVNFMANDEFEIHYLSNDQFEYKSMEGKITKYRRAKTFTPKEDELKAFVGRYESDELKSAIIISREKNGLELLFEHMGDRKLPLNAVDPGVFQVSRVYIKFLRDKQGKVTAMNFTNPFARNMDFKKVQK
jgi:CubicO group peptidase (beta-lactamase class C family)